MEKRSSSEFLGTIASPDSPMTQSNVQDSRRIDTLIGVRSSREDDRVAFGSEVDSRASGNSTDTGTSGSELRDVALRSVEESVTCRSEARAMESEDRFFRAEETTRERRAAEYRGAEHAHRSSYGPERQRTTAYSRKYKARVSSERRQKRSESPRRRRPVDEHWSREDYERRRRNLRAASLRHLVRRRYSSLSFGVTSGQSRSSALYRRAQWQPSRRMPESKRSTLDDRRDVRPRHLPSVETVRRESDGMRGSAPSSEPHAPGTATLADPPAIVAVSSTSQSERIIPELPLVGYHLEDPRKEDYAPGFRREPRPQEYKPVNPASVSEEHYKMQQPHGSAAASVGHRGQVSRDIEHPPMVRAHRGRQSYMLPTESHERHFVHRPDLRPWHYQYQEHPNFCPRCPTYLGSFVSFCMGGPRPEESLLNYCPRSLENTGSSEGVLQTGGLHLGNPYGRGSQPVLGFQPLTWRDASRMRQPPREQETWLDYPHELADIIFEGMIDTLRAQSDEVDALRADMRDVRSRMANFVASEKKAQDQSRAFIAAVKAQMDKPN
nr:uncharacterized protein LOC126544525 [Dermacentor andersoni]XP_054917061.1 uncharacterized protein LOC126544525 [Dermacentor andersoni]XP_054917062.1 uncharacterized protein LOC126544525 [Dermacentor andersoni]